MSVSKYLQARELINRAGGGDFEGAKPESLVAQAEAALGLTFPPSYRSFLLELGCGDFNGLEVYGLIDDDFDHSSIPNAIWLSLNERKTIGLDRSYVIVGSAGDGTYYAIDTRLTSDSGEAPVVHLSVDGQRSDRIADSFGDYLLAAVRSLV